VIGCGGVALAEAESLAAVAGSVTLLAPGGLEDGAADGREHVLGLANVTVLPVATTTVLTEGDRLVGVEYRDSDATPPRVLPVDGVFGALDGVPNAELLTGLSGFFGLSKVETGDDRAATTDAAYGIPGQPGLFAIGDVRAGNPRRLDLAVTDGRAVARGVARHLGSTG
jgi:thioredoxin reductase (NADPH)